MMVRYFMLVVVANILYNVSVNGESTFTETDNTQCGNIFTETKFYITSENYPLPYPPEKECFYLIKGRKCTIKFRIEFLDFDVKSSVGCTKDRLEIGHQDALCGTTNGSKVYTADKGSLKLKFISDNNKHEKMNRGFKVLITRIDACDVDTSSSESSITFDNKDTSEFTTEVAQVEWTSKKPLLGPSYLPPIPQQCCQNNIYASKRFLLVSPNFPQSSNTPTDCIYIIKKASSQVCRLRIDILLFSLGPPTESSCPNGHLEIDGKYICGCNSDVKLTTDFHDSDRKVLKYHSSGYNANELYGFVLEITQDECPKKYSPDNGASAERSSGHFRFYNDQDNKIAWPKYSNIDQLKLVNEKIQWFPPENNRLENQFGNVYKHFYFFAPREEEDISWTQNGQEREESNNIDISTINTLLTNLYHYEQCVQWNANQMILLNKRFGNNLYSMCKSFQQSNIDKTQCLILNSLDGNIRSPRYPLAYPISQNSCYRFQILPGYCAVNLLFDDFHIEKSYDCLKDYLAINEYRYCGNYLKNKQVTIYSKGKSHQDIKFITDSNYCGKGFSAVYQQVPCPNTDYPIKDNSCNPSMERTESPLADCNKIIRENNFIIRKDARASFCSFNIEKSSEDICKINFYFKRFNLPCELESVTINGKVYCGQMSGNTLTIDIVDETTIFYKKNSVYTATEYDGDFLIQGAQTGDNCETDIPEPVRLTSRNSKANKVFSTGHKDKKIYSNYYPDICLLIKNNVTVEDLPNKICELLTNNHNVPDCTYSKANIVDASVDEKNTTTIQLTSGKAEELNYEVIECQN